MRISGFKLENVRNIRFAECNDLPNLIVICGVNGSGKSTLLSVINEERDRSIGRNYSLELRPKAFKDNNESTNVELKIEWSDVEKSASGITNLTETIGSVSTRNGRGSRGGTAIRSFHERWQPGSQTAGCLEYVSGERTLLRSQIKGWEPSSASIENIKQSFSSGTKSPYTKSLLTEIYLKHLQEVDIWMQNGGEKPLDPLCDFKVAFHNLFSPLSFSNIDITKTPFRFVISTPTGEIDIDDLSSGEKEVLHMLVRFHYLKPKNFILLFDEPELHLHPDLQRRYFGLLKDLSKDNQVWIATHSPEMAIAAGHDSLFALSKGQLCPGSNQFTKVSNSEERYVAMRELMGTTGFLSFDRSVIFIEGIESSADKIIYEYFYPSERFNLLFVPAGNCRSVSSLAQKIDCLLSETTEYQQFFSIIDGDFEPLANNSLSHQSRLIRLPVYHVENFLLHDERIFDATRDQLADKFDMKTPNAVGQRLKDLLLSDKHLCPYAKALCAAKSEKGLAVPTFEEVKEEAKILLLSAIDDDTWRFKCKGRELLKAYCAQYSLTYEYFRNALLRKFLSPPEHLSKIIDPILQKSQHV